MKKNNKKNNKASLWIRTRELSPQATSYDGPCVPNYAKKQESLFTVVLAQAASVSSTAGGIINQVFGINPSGASEWSSFAAVFDEYRVLAIKVRYFPSNRYDPGLTQAQQPLYMVGDHSGNAAIASLAAAASYESVKIKGTGDPMSMTQWMDGSEESVYTNTASIPSTQYYIKMFSHNLAVSSQYGEYLQTFLVQFKGHGI